LALARLSLKASNRRVSSAARWSSPSVFSGPSSPSNASPQALLQTGFQLLQQGRMQEAWNAFQTLVRLDPNSALGHHMVGLIALRTGQLDLGVQSLRRSIALDPSDPSAYGNLANGLRDLGRTDEALQAYGKALAVAPTFLDALNNRANLLVKIGRHADALADYDRAIAQNARVPSLHNQRANALRLLERHDDALQACAAALALDPAHAEALLNRATVLGELGRHRDAVADYEACLALNPDQAEAQFYGATAYLALGDYARGWPRYEARKRLKGAWRVVSALDDAAPAWFGETSLEGKTLLLHAEQGLGDTLQFARYANLAKAQGATVILQVDAPLVSLISTLKGADRVIAKDGARPPFDLHASIMSLPGAFRTTLDTVPAATPYLSADTAKVAAWAQRLGPKTRPRVGLVWAGGLKPDRPDLVRRNIPLRLLEPLAQADVDFVSLQKGEGTEGELAALLAQGWTGPAMIEAAADLHDFSDTAALVQALDLVITVDTSTAHLAGALGKPVWILNRYDNCWRWMTDRADTPWYPTARLFRQRTFGDWTPVVGEVVEALRVFAG
jgi:tetratricopeptide (TPR) repeat protein